MATAVGLDMRWILFHETAVKDHLEICQTIMWSLEISNFTNLDSFKVDKTPEILGIATLQMYQAILWWVYTLKDEKLWINTIL